MLFPYYQGISHSPSYTGVTSGKHDWSPYCLVHMPIKMVSVNGRICFSFATTGDNPITDDTCIHQMVKIFTNSGIFTQAIHKRNLKTPAQKTMANLITHFTQAGVECCLLIPTTKATLVANAGSPEAHCSSRSQYRKTFLLLVAWFGDQSSTHLHHLQQTSPRP